MKSVITGVFISISNTSYAEPPLLQTNQTDPYQVLIDHYGSLNRAYWMEIGLSRISNSLSLVEASPKQRNSRLINFKLIEMTGNIPFYSYDSSTPKKNGEGNFSSTGIHYATDTTKQYLLSQRIDWDKNDAFTNALDDIFENAYVRINETVDLGELFKKSIWDKADRILWEQTIADIVNDETSKIPGLGIYRYSDEQGRALERPPFLNALSFDIVNNSQTIEFDCEAMSVVKGLILQRIEYAFLEPQKDNEHNYKQASNYFLAMGRVIVDLSKMPIGHAFIVSSATGNIIEATRDPYRTPYLSAYLMSNDPDYTFDDFVRGQPFENEHKHIYGGDIYKRVNQLRQEDPLYTISNTPPPV